MTTNINLDKKFFMASFNYFKSKNGECDCIMKCFDPIMNLCV